MAELEKVDAPVRGDLNLMLREFAAQAPDARVVTIAHDDGCPAIGTRNGCTCEVVTLLVAGVVPGDVAW